ncbi:uncharacterized protein SPSK_00641 [Sporothrix schenckii 1099-18]|uniref:Uncharacterized protein n=1 Tax=Sporothrix schenckii 1099-18 TaxID=1397361 RepID=A0A0F2LSY1_SPOSC|nr:uncharacterized protein SPSK_00641 [Sporothrix schenckii 1099-18]KJR79959.1 hypothetical protein SPSK_00641 [Sporothrix schenckii 1099-18]
MSGPASWDEKGLWERKQKTCRAKQGADQASYQMCKRHTTRAGLSLGSTGSGRALQLQLSLAPKIVQNGFWGRSA